MPKSAILLYFATVYLYCRYLAGYAGHDFPVYVAALLFSLFALREHRLLSKGFLFNLLFIAGATTWVCHFFLDPPYRLVTERLMYVRGSLLGLFLVLELVAAVHILRRYRKARRELAMFACDAFGYALAPYPMLPGLYKVFHVEFNIWRALLVRCKLTKDHDGACMARIGRIDPGYRRGAILAVVAGLAGFNALCAWLLPPLWYLAPLLATVYVALLLHCELMQFGRHAIYADDAMLRIPNGIYGFVSIERAKVESVSFDAPASPADLAVSRLSPANLYLHLNEPVRVFDVPVKTVGLCVPEDTRQHIAARLGHGAMLAH